MLVRSIALAVPLALGAAACTSSGSQSDRSTTATTTPSPTPGRDPMAVPGPAIKGHAEDQVISGTISEVSPSSVAIQSTMGETKRLDIEPETSVKVDGADASHAELREGQPVRASYSEVEGREIAVEIRAGDPSLYDAPASGVPGSATPAYPPTGTGSSSDVPTGRPGSTVPREPESSTPAYPPSR